MQVTLILLKQVFLMKKRLENFLRIRATNLVNLISIPPTKEEQENSNEVNKPIIDDIKKNVYLNVTLKPLIY